MMFERGNAGAGGEVVIPEEGMYVLRFEGIENERIWPAEEEGGEPNKSLFLTFTIERDIEVPGSEYEGREVKFWFPSRFTPGNKTGRLFAAMFGGELPSTFGGEESELIGRRVQAVLKKGENGYLRLDSALPVRSRRQDRQEALGGEPPF